MNEPQAAHRPGDPPSPTLADRLKQKLGAELDAVLTLEGEPEASSAGNLLERLLSDAPRGTRYRILGELARGGMGVILKVWDDELRRTLAMKVVLEDGAERATGSPGSDRRRLGRFLEEAQVTGQLDHPGIVPVHELGLGADGRVYFTMRLVKGVDLRTIFANVLTGQDGWNQVRALGVLLRVCEAMSYAHSKQVVHRDLKPANVMVGKFGEVYVMDWGLARVLGREDKHDLRLQANTQSVVLTERRELRDQTPDSPLVTMDGDVVGTPSFMPLEQAQGQLDMLGPHSDVYSIGAMLYQLLTGQMPYQPPGARVSQRTVLNALLHGAPDPVEALAPGTPAELAAICEKAMARDIAERYPTTSALADDLRAYLEGRVVRAYATGPWIEARKWVERNQLLAAVLAALAVVLVVTTPLLWNLLQRARHATDLADASTRKAVAAQTMTLDVLSVYRALRRPDMLNVGQKGRQDLTDIEQHLSKIEFEDPGMEAEIHLALADLHMGAVYGRERLEVDLARPHPEREALVRARDQLRLSIGNLRSCQPARPERLGAALYYLSQMGLEALDDHVLTLQESRDALVEAMGIFKSLSPTEDARVVLMQGDLAFAAAMLSSGTKFTDEELDWLARLFDTPRFLVRPFSDALANTMAREFRRSGLKAGVEALRSSCKPVEANPALRGFLAAGMERASLVHRKRGQLEAAAVTLAYALELEIDRSASDGRTWSAMCRLADQLAEAGCPADSARYYRDALALVPLVSRVKDEEIAALVSRAIKVHADADQTALLRDTLAAIGPAVARTFGQESAAAKLVRESASAAQNR